MGGECIKELNNAIYHFNNSTCAETLDSKYSPFVAENIVQQTITMML